MCEHERRPLGFLNDVGDSKCLSAASDAEEHLVLGPLVQSVDDLFYRLRLIAFRGIFRNETKLHSLIIDQNCLLQN